MPIEVEMKFAVPNAGELLRRLSSLRPKADNSQIEIDIYYNHPSRDFSLTDEAFRIRRIGEENQITYKGPLLELQTKTREEFEAGLLPGELNFHVLSEILGRLGFIPVREVQKERVKYHFQWEERPFEMCLDNVAGLGQYVELETLVPDDSPSLQNLSRESLLRLAEWLGLSVSERRSYLRLLLEKQTLVSP